MLVFFPFCFKFFFFQKRWKTQIFKSLLTLLYHLWKTARRQFRSFSMHCKCMTVQTFVLWVNQGLCHLCSVSNTAKIFPNLMLKTKNELFGLWKNTYHTISINGKRLIIEFSCNFLYVLYEIVLNCMKLFRSVSYMEIVWKEVLVNPCSLEVSILSNLGNKL